MRAAGSCRACCQRPLGLSACFTRAVHEVHHVEVVTKRRSRPLRRCMHWEVVSSVALDILAEACRRSLCEGPRPRCFRELQARSAMHGID